MGPQNENKTVYISFLEVGKFKALIKWKMDKEGLIIKNRRWHTAFTDI